jgi:hypothetical protein
VRCATKIRDKNSVYYSHVEEAPGGLKRPSGNDEVPKRFPLLK